MRFKCNQFKKRREIERTHQSKSESKYRNQLRRDWKRYLLPCKVEMSNESGGKKEFLLALNCLLCNRRI